MNLFLLTKHNSIQENILFCSNNILKILTDKMNIDALFMEYTKNQNIKLNLNIERILFLSLTFLHAVGKVDFDGIYITRIDND